MAWISVDNKVIGGELRKLYKSIGCSRNEALGIVVTLMLWGLNNADRDGLIVSGGVGDIAEVLEPGLDPSLNADEIVEKLIECEWLIRKDEDLYINHWMLFTDIQYKEADRNRKNAERVRRCRAAKKSEKTEAVPELVKEDNAIEIAEVEAPDIAEENPAPAVTEEPVPEELAQPEPEEKPETVPEEKPAAKPKKVKGIEYSEEFEQFWAAYPRGRDKGEAYKKYKARLNDGYKDEELLLAAENYATQCRIRRTEESYIKHAKTFLGPAMPFLEYLPKKEDQKPPEPDFADGVNPFRL